MNAWYVADIRVMGLWEIVPGSYTATNQIFSFVKFFQLIPMMDQSAAMYIRSVQTNCTSSLCSSHTWSKFDSSHNLKNYQNRDIIYIEKKGKVKPLNYPLRVMGPPSFPSLLFISVRERDKNNLTFSQNRGIIYIQKRGKELFLFLQCSLTS